MEARVAILGSSLTGPNYRVANFKLLKNKNNLVFSENFWKKSQKTSNLENYEELSSHTWRQDSQSLRIHWQDPTTGLGISDFAGKKLIKFSETFLKKSQKTSYLENYNDLNSHIWRQDLYLLRVFWQQPTTRLGIFKFWEILNKNVLKIFEKITINIISRKLQGFEQSNLEARFAIPDSTLTVPNYRVGNFSFFKKRII